MQGVHVVHVKRCTRCDHIVALFHMEQDYMEQDYTKYMVCQVYKVWKVYKVYNVYKVWPHGSLVTYGTRLYGKRLYCSIRNKTLWSKSFSIWNKTYYVMKWLSSDTKISEITCFSLLKMIKKQKIGFFCPLPPYLCSIYVLCPVGLHIIYFLVKKPPKIVKLQRIKSRKWQKGVFIAMQHLNQCFYWKIKFKFLTIFSGQFCLCRWWHGAS